MDQIILDYETVDEANNLLQNGILVETSKGLVCMSLNDALSSDLNLSVEDLKSVATKLILQENIQPSNPNSNKRVFPQTANLNFDSDGFSSECSDISTTSASSIQSTSRNTHVNTTQIIITNDNNISGSKVVSFLPSSSNVDVMKNLTTQANNIIPNQNHEIKIVTNTNSSNTLSNEIKSINNNQTVNDTNTVVEVKKQKGRGGWPKGRKRKPELLNLPPKAPATGYNLYLNEQRKLFKDSSLVFHEITKVIGNKWSNLSLEEKQPYLAKAEEDKRRYREELKQYRQSDAYQAYLLKKRKNRLQNNVLSESDMDATDEIDDEDNEELYCRTCDQWFHNLHNKREHLQGRQHTQTVAGEIKRELSSGIGGSIATATSTTNLPSAATSLDESSLDGTLNILGLKGKGKSKSSNSNNSSNSVMDSITNLIQAISKREKEIKMLKQRLQETIIVQNALRQQLTSLTERQNKLKTDLNKLKNKEREIEAQVFRLWQVPSWFIITNFDTESTNTDNNEEL